MNLIEELAKQMGLSIAQLSNYLGISKSFLSMSIQGKRNLPARHFKALLAIQQQLNGIETPARLALQPEEAKRLRKRLHRAEAQYFATQRKLQQQEERFAQLYRQQQWILLELQRSPDLPQRQRLWLELQQLAVQQRLRQHGAGAIADTKARLEALRSLVAVLDAALQDV
ncbi:helix-turn-helix domain-containing protein [Phnomibacter sp. MR]|uniref:helix-turn-helix domain-containing protein n=1 Tax=Phnomibacter sp. MR TaxID=3042318 RepID=UPI003A80EC1E